MLSCWIVVMERMSLMNKVFSLSVVVVSRDIVRLPHVPCTKLCVIEPVHVLVRHINRGLRGS